jgi:ATP-binding cassette, subfamily B, beta-glucan exporter
MGVVFQEPFIFAHSIEENLRLGKPDATKAEMERALEQAQALDFVRHAPTDCKRSSASVGATFRAASGNGCRSPARS